MDGILEQILVELKEIKALLTNEKFESVSHIDEKITTFKVKDAAKYAGVSEWFLRTQAKQGKVAHILTGSRYLFKRVALDEWLKKMQEDSVKPEEETIQRGVLRKIPEKSR